MPIHYGDIHTKRADIIGKSTMLPFITGDGYEVLHEKDLVVADASEDYQGIAEPAVIVELNNRKIVAGLHTIVLRPNKTDALFLYYLLHTDIFKKYGAKAGTGMKVFGISYPNLSKFEAHYPVRTDEQQKIGTFFQNLDTLIAGQKRKVELLKELKKGYLQKIFTQEIRFSGFTQEWDVKKLGEMGVIIKTGKLDANAAIKNGKYPFFTTAIETSKINSYSFDDDVILVAGNGPVGYIKTYYGKFDAYQREYIISNFLEIDKIYLAEAMKYFLPKDIAKKLSGSAMPYMTLDVLTDLEVFFPQDFIEQQLIGQFFQNLDTQISSVDKKLSALIDLKKSYLQQLFI